MANTTTTITVVWGKGQSILRAGTPLGENGAICNDSNAIGILSNDIMRPSTTATIITAGTWNEEYGRAHCGIALSDECKRKLKNIAFVDSDGKQQYTITNPIPTAGKNPTGNGNAYEMQTHFSGKYDDLENKPVMDNIPEITDDTVSPTVFNTLINELIASGLMAGAEEIGE